MSAIAALCDEPDIAARLHTELGLSAGAEVVLQFAEGNPKASGPLREIHRALSAEGEDERIVADLRRSLLNGPSDRTG